MTDETPGCNNPSSVFSQMKKQIESNESTSDAEKLINDANAEESKTDSEIKKHCVFKN